MTACNSLRSVMKHYEKQHIHFVLHRLNWNKPKTARVLGIGLSTLYRKIAEYKIRRK